jgi:hypothetical protein
VKKFSVCFSHTAATRSGNRRKTMNIALLTKRAWEIRKMAAKRFGKKTMSISWRGCLQMAFDEIKPMRVFRLNVPYRLKDAAKAAGAKWNFSQKFWFFEGRELPVLLEKFA